MVVMLSALRLPLTVGGVLLLLCLLGGMVAVAAGAMMALALLDTAARLVEYRRLVRSRINHRLAHAMRASACQRDVVIAAAKRTHFDAAGFYRSLGYRWYHVIPDGFPGCVLRLSWWKSLVPAWGKI